MGGIKPLETPTSFSYLNSLCFSHPLTKIISPLCWQSWYENQIRMYICMKKWNGTPCIIDTQPMVAPVFQLHTRNDFYFSPKDFQKIHFHKFAFSEVKYGKTAVLNSISQWHFLFVDDFYKLRMARGSMENASLQWRAGAYSLIHAQNPWVLPSLALSRATYYICLRFPSILLKASVFILLHRRWPRKILLALLSKRKIELWHMRECAEYMWKKGRVRCPERWVAESVWTLSTGKSMTKMK